MLRRSHLMAGLALLAAGAITFFNVPLASSQGLTLIAESVSGDLPTLDPASSLWAGAVAVEVPLSAQAVTKPMLAETQIRSVRARALHNGSQLAILVEWSDDTQDDQVVRSEDFRDAVAVQFPLTEGQPFFCMGQAGGNVNIWHWKADWQADLVARQDVETVYPNLSVGYYPFTAVLEGAVADVSDYTDTDYLTASAAGNLLASAMRLSPVEDLMAGGFGTTTAQPDAEQNVGGFGLWDADRWQVIFTRTLSSSEEADVSFGVGQLYPMAFAVWDGSNGERNGQKSTSQWISLEITRPAAAAAVGEEPQPVAAPANREPFIFIFAPMVAVAGLIALTVGLIFVVGSVLERRR